MKQDYSKDFKKGVEYESTRKQLSLHSFMGWGCIGFSIFMLITPNRNIYSSGFLFLFGLLSLHIAKSERKELKKILRRRK